jgi:hypothetical protein
MLLLPVITLAIGANTVELDYNVQMGALKTTTAIYQQQTVPDARQEPTGLVVYKDARRAEGFAFDARRPAALTIMPARAALSSAIVSRQSLVAMPRSQVMGRPGGPWPERTVHLPIIPGTTHLPIIPGTTHLPIIPGTTHLPIIPGAKI